MSHNLKRLAIATAITKALQFPSLLHLYDKSTHSIFPLLRRLISITIRFMESILFGTEDDDDFFTNPLHQVLGPPPFSDPGESIFLVSFRWWKEAVCGGGIGLSEVVGTSYNAAVRLKGDDDVYLGYSDILVEMERKGLVGIDGEDGASDGKGHLALLSEWMFFTALKWHHDIKGVGSLVSGDDCADDLCSLQITLSHVRETSQLTIKISRKDNGVRDFEKALRIFHGKSGMLQVWDFSRETTQLFVTEGESSMDADQSNEVPLKLKVYGSSTLNDEESSEEDMSVDGPSSSSLVMMNGNVVDSSFRGTGALGLTGLYNLGNTCFMNSAIQCLVHTPKLVDYFLWNFREDLSFENPLGMNGKLAIAFGNLLRKLWAPRAKPVEPRMFKSTISSFAPQFGGYNQHDSQEFLSFLLDGLHEDLNRVKRKPYIQAKDENGRPDEEVAEEYWRNHLSRNDSIIVDLCQGQYRSTLVCPVCRELSTTFDPFMYLSLPLPSSSSRKMTLTVFSTNGSNLPHPVTIAVPANGTLKDLVETLGIVCSLKDDETLLIAEIYNNSILRFLDDPDDSIDLIRDFDKLVAYRLPKDMDGSPLVVFMHQQKDKSYHSFSVFKKFGIPLVARMSDLSRGSEIRKEFLKLIYPFYGELLNDDDASSSQSAHEDEGKKDIEAENDLDAADCDFEFYLHSESVYSTRECKIQMDEGVDVSDGDKSSIKVLVSWPEKMIQEYDTSILCVSPEVCNSASRSLWTDDSISLYKCVDAFLKEEPLGPDDMWYCPKCKEHRQASKKLDLWRLPEILVIHLKRFSFNKFQKNKLESLVDFPIDDFDLSKDVIQKGRYRYMLYAVSNHYGRMGSGHYTAFAKHHQREEWYEFDDSQVSHIDEERIKSQAAYVLFYKRI